MEFQTSGALRWLETTGLAEAAGQGQEFGSSQVVNITLGGERNNGLLLLIPPRAVHANPIIGAFIELGPSETTCL